MSERTMNAMLLNSVSLSKLLVARNVPKEEYRMSSILSKFVVSLAMERPTWRFEADQSHGPQDIVGATIFQDGEKLGEVRRTYYKNEYCLEVRNHRIEYQRQRGGGYRTLDVTKAVTKAKKMFSRKSIVERVHDAVQQVNEVISTVRRDKEYEVRQCTQKVQEAMLAYVQGEGRVHFSAHLQEDTARHRITLSAIEQREELRSDIVTISAVGADMSEGTTAVVIKVDSQYVVSRQGSYKIVDDNSLPEEFRGKLGMLKLVNPHQFVEGIGSRITDDVFVLLVEPNTVSEGEAQ